MGNRSEKMKRLLCCAAICGLFSYMFYESDYVQKKVFYPYPYRETIDQYAQYSKLDPALVAGVVLSESKFRQHAESHKGAIGLMQLMPETAAWIAGQTGEWNFQIDDLHDPEMNIKFGTWYLASLYDEFSGNEVLMLAAYNAGRGNVKEWMEKYNWTMEFSDVSQIPFSETREYVKKVLKSRDRYRELYGFY